MTTMDYPSTTSYPQSSNTPVGKKSGTGKEVLGVNFEDDERNKRILATVNEWYANCKNNRAPIERQWYINMAFHAGRQNIRMVSTPGVNNGFKLTTPKAPPWRVRLVINRTRKYVRTELSKITASRPRFFVVPATSEDEDQIAARVAEQIFSSVYSNYDLKRVIRQAEWWTVVCGIGFTKTYWDSDKIDEYSKAQGDFCYDALTPFHIYVPNLQEINIQKQPYVIHAMTKSLDWVKNTYPELKNVNANTSSGDILDGGFLKLVGATNVRKEEVLMLEVWVKPGNGLFPNGALVTIVGDQVAQVTNGFPYKHGRYPFQKLENIESGSFYTTSVLEDLIPLQREFNRTRSQIIEAKNLMAKPKLLYAAGSLDPKQITSEPGQGIPYKMGYPAPTPLQLSPLPNYVMQELQQLSQDMDDLAGQHEISRGQNPSQVTAATALSFLKEQDDTVLAGVIQSLESALEDMGQQTLGLFTQFCNTERMIRVVGADATFDAQLYKASSIKNNQDIRVESGSALPQSKAAKQAFVMDLLKMGFIPPEKGLEMLEIGGIEKIYEEYNTDVRQAQRENQKMTMGMPVEANDFDNHAVHMEIHNKFRKGQQYESLDDMTKELFQNHVMAHQQAMQTGLAPGGQFPEDASGAIPGQMPLPGMDQGGPPGAPPQDPSQQPPSGGIPNG